MTTHQLAVLGNPVAHSRSPEIHGHFASQCGLAVNYERIQVPPGQFDQVAGVFMETGLGCNVTLPCKGEAFRFVDEASPRATLAGAVNTISRGPQGRLLGDNTDGEGLITDIRENLGWQISGMRLLVLGAGGAVAGVLGTLLAAEPACIDVFNRTPEKAERLVHQYGAEQLRAVDAASLGSGYDLVINGTSAGLTGGTISLPPKVLADHSRCYDMVYGHEVTGFNRWCMEQAGCETADGLGMLVEQAALSFNIWFDRQVETVSVIAALRNEAAG